MTSPVLGIDMGTCAIKLVVLDKNKNRVYSRFQKHSGSPAGCLKTMLSEIASNFPKVRMGMTGSQAEPIAEQMKKVPADNPDSREKNWRHGPGTRYFAAGRGAGCGRGVPCHGT